jgi:ORF6N domain
MNQIIIPNEIITNKIYYIRGQKVMLDRDLAELFEVKPYRLREAVSRNSDKFPEHFMFRLNEIEVEMMIAEKAITSKQ